MNTGCAALPPPACDVRELADPDRHDEVSERDHSVKGLGQQDSIVEKAQEIVGAFRPVLHRHRNGLLDAIPLRVIADVDRRHTLIQSDHQRVHGYANRDDAEAWRPEVREAEREDQRERDHQESVAESLDLVVGELDELEQHLDGESQGEEPTSGNGQSRQFGEAAERQQNDERCGGDRQHQQPHDGQR